MAQNEDFETKARELEKILRNIIAVGDQNMPVAARLNKILRIAGSAFPIDDTPKVAAAEAGTPF